MTTKEMLIDKVIEKIKSLDETFEDIMKSLSALIDSPEDWEEIENRSNKLVTWVTHMHMMKIIADTIRTKKSGDHPPEAFAYALDGIKDVINKVKLVEVQTSDTVH